MINTSNEYKKYIADSVNSTLSRDFRAKADIELADGTVLTITEEDIVVGGLKINDATSSNNSFQIGSAIINQCTLMLNNIGGKFDQYDFTDAVIRPYIGLKLSETTEWLKKGIFTVDEPTVASSIISLVALDNMNKFDTPFSDVTISFPCTQLQLLQAVCLHCGVSLTNATFTNSDFTITRRPDDEAITCREIVAWIAQNSGNFARCNTDGALELKWYDITAFEQSDSLDGGVFDSNTPYSSGDVANGGDFTFSEIDNYDGGTFLQMEKYHHIYALNQATIGTDDVIITGIQVKAQGTQSDYGETVLFGTKGYVIEITNPLITENTASIIANSVGAKIVGMRFRPCDILALSDPSREAGDVAYLSHKNNTYQILLTNVTYQIGASDSIKCDAETPSRKQSVRFDASTKAIVEARKTIKKELTAYNIAVEQLTNLMANSFGVHKSKEVLEDGSTIYYTHDKPTLAESETIWKMTADAFVVSTDGGQTWNAGFDSEGNAVVNVLNAIGINAEWIKATGAIEGVEIITDKGKIAGLNITESGLSSDNDIIAITNSYDAQENPIQGKIKVRDSIPNPEEGIVDSYSEVRGDGFHSTVSHSTDPFSRARTDSAFTPTYGLNINSYSSDGGITSRLSLGKNTMYQESADNFFIFQLLGGAETMMFNDDGMDFSSQKKIALGAPDIEINGNMSGVKIDGRTMMDIEKKISYNLNYILNIIIKLESMGIVIDPPPSIN